MPGDPGYDPFDLAMVRAAYESLPPEQRVVKIETAQALDRVQKAEGNVQFGPSASNSANALRHAARPYQSSQETTELDAETAYSLSLRQWLAGGSIGPRPKLSDFIARHRLTTQKAEGLGTRINRTLHNLFTSGI